MFRSVESKYYDDFLFKPMGNGKQKPFFRHMKNISGKQAKSPFLSIINEIVLAIVNMPPPFLRTRSLFAPKVANPFIYHLKFPWYRKIQVAIATVLLIPVIRVILSVFCFLMAWVFGSISLAGLSPETLATVPLSGWRRSIHSVVLFWCRASYFMFGFHRRIIGEVADRKDAPTIVLAPHSSFFDVGCGLALDDVPYAVSRAENMSIPLVGIVFRLTQTVAVVRRDKASRQKVIDELKTRVQSEGVWPQLILFPEGTTTNRQALITFKPGAFIPGMPVQPVVIRYPDAWDTVTWAWEGAGVGVLFWLTLCKLWTTIEMEFLPVYTPSEAERENAYLYADNVRSVMAEALNVPVTDHTFEDCRLMEHAAKANLKLGDGLVEFRKMQKKLGLSYEDIHSLMGKFGDISQLSDIEGRVDLKTFAKYMDLPVSETLSQLFSMYDRDGSGNIDFREYVIGMSLISEPARADDSIRLAFKLFDKDGDGYVSQSEFADLLMNILITEKEEADALFEKLDSSQSGKLTFEDFKACAADMPEYAALFTTYYSQEHSSDSSLLERRSSRDVPRTKLSSDSANPQATPSPVPPPTSPTDGTKAKSE
ncbi:LPCAT2 [Bugula neritina]|uniref:LPCAT2 n=1 Tax=Bugula neritina TaxID=10212 RepID=A0A7J7KNB6_BUGNE|nr:LPCAT2 [Bugula neritina]